MDADCKINTCSKCLMCHFPGLHVCRRSHTVYSGSQVSYTNMGNRDVSLAITLPYQMESWTCVCKKLSKILSQKKKKLELKPPPEARVDRKITSRHSLDAFYFMKAPLASVRLQEMQLHLMSILNSFF